MSLGILTACQKEKPTPSITASEQEIKEEYKIRLVTDFGYIVGERERTIKQGESTKVTVCAKEGYYFLIVNAESNEDMNSYNFILIINENGEQSYQIMVKATSKLILQTTIVPKVYNLKK
ncbi:MAG: hypothetical protein NC182_03065 [Prevotella sp.]|nr:hypothetical protein [Staphylococcus sp.]MCM1350157.1 hypothetical protein [Prevotella sp.]